MTKSNLYYSLILFTLVSLLPISSFATQSNELFSQIKSYAELADAAYLNKMDAQREISRQGYQLEMYNSVPDAEVVYLLMTDPIQKQQIISIRGTANIENALLNISLKLLPNEYTKIDLHQGFSQAAEAIYQAIQPSLKKDYKISLTGHSLGGAVAVILAMYMDVDHYDIGSIITFGQPKVTNIAGSQKFAHLELIRVVTEKDVIPLVPPLDVLDIKDIDIYWHLGLEVVLLEGNKYALLKGLQSIMRATKVINTEMNEENLQHHTMAAYLAQLEQKSQVADRVPYDTSINIFQLFGGST